MDMEAEEYGRGVDPMGFWSSLLTFKLFNVEYSGMHLVATRVDHNGDILRAWIEILARFTMFYERTSVLLRLIGTDDFFILPECAGIDTEHYLVVDRYAYNDGQGTAHEISDSDSDEALEPAYVRRPRNSFILYRIWMCSEIGEENPELTMAAMSQVISNMWRNEDLYVKSHFKSLAAEEDRRHKAMYPRYRYGEEVRRRAYLPLTKQNLTQNPMDVSRLIIERGY